MAATVLWRQVHIHLCDADRRRFDALLISTPNDILDNVKDLVIRNDSSVLDGHGKQQASSDLLNLLTALPQDTLFSVHSERFTIHPDMIRFFTENSVSATRTADCY